MRDVVDRDVVGMRRAKKRDVTILIKARAW
jgi:hypothetical protein